jgi:hypothetical protein
VTRAAEQGDTPVHQTNAPDTDAGHQEQAVATVTNSANNTIEASNTTPTPGAAAKRLA